MNSNDCDFVSIFSRHFNQPTEDIPKPKQALLEIEESIGDRVCGYR